MQKMGIKESLKHYETKSNSEPKVLLSNRDGWHHYIDSVTNEDVPSLPLSLIEAMKALVDSTYKQDDDFISLCQDLKIVGKKK